MLGGMARKTNDQLKAELEALKAELETTRDQRDTAQAQLNEATLVQWSARIPKSLRDEVHALRGELSAQDVTMQSLRWWIQAAKGETTTT